MVPLVRSSQHACCEAEDNWDRGRKTGGLTTRSDSVTCPPIPPPCGPLFARFVVGALCGGEEVLFPSGSGTGGVSDIIWCLAMVQLITKYVFWMDCG